MWSLWLLGLSSIAFMGMTGRALLRRVALSRILTQVWLIAMLILAISMQIHHWLEFYWLEQDTLLEISSEAPGFGRYEAQIASIMRSELLALLENTQPE